MTNDQLTALLSDSDVARRTGIVLRAIRMQRHAEAKGELSYAAASKQYGVSYATLAASSA